MSGCVVSAAIDPGRVQEEVADSVHGAVVSFVGLVRDHHAGRKVTGLEYSSYLEMAEHECVLILGEAESRFNARVAIRHRTGKLAIGDVAVVVACAAAHRDTAFEAARWTIDAVKSRVPIWKHEHYSDGTSAWVDPTAPGGLA